MKFRVKLLYMGNPVYEGISGDMTREKTEKTAHDLIEKYRENYFIKDLPLDVVIEPIE